MDDSGVLLNKTGVFEQKYKEAVVKRFSFVDGWGSIASIALMCSLNIYFVGHIREPPCSCNQLSPDLQLPDLQLPANTSANPLGSSIVESFRSSIAVLDTMYQLSISDGYDSTSCENQVVTWNTVAFVLTVVGSGFGLVLEFFLLAVCWRPYETNLTRLISQLHDYRRANFALVLVTSTFTVVCLVVENHGFVLHRILLGSFFLAGSLSVGAYFDTEPLLALVALLLLGSQVVLPLTFGTVVGGRVVARFAALSGFTQILSLLPGVDTPTASMAFHVVSTMASYFLYLAVAIARCDNPSFPSSVERALFPQSPWTPVKCGLFFMLGLVSFLRASTTTYQALRTTCSYVVWTGIYGIVAADRILNSNPYKLSEIYKETLPEPLTLVPFGKRRYMVKPLNVPSVSR